MDEIKKIYENKVIPFENTDDSYKSKMSAYYSEWSSMGDKFSDAGNAIRDFLAGIGDSLVDTVKGLLTLVVDLGILYVDVRWKSIVPIQVPEVLDQEVEKIKQKYEPLLKDPVNTIGGIGQSICDTADEKGVAYSSGYIVTEVVTALLADKGLDKIKNVAKTGKTADNVADIAEEAESAAEDAGKAGKTAEKVGESGRYTDSQIADIINNLKGDGFKNNPLRQAYENEVAGLKSYGEELLSSGMSEDQVARTLNQARRDLGIKYKNATPQPLRDYIYEVNMRRYGDKLGPTYDWLVSERGATNMEIINSSSRPNANIDKLLSGFEEWLRRQ